MSRIGKYPVIIPEGVSVEINENVVTAKGKLGELQFSYDSANVTAKIEDGQVVITPLSKTKLARSLWGTVKSVINNLVTGVSVGFKKDLELIGVGYRARVAGRELVLSLGFSHEINYEMPEGIEITCATPTQISVFGMNKEVVGQTAAEIREYRKPEPYKGKGVRYVGEYVRRKEGKKK